MYETSLLTTYSTRRYELLSTIVCSLAISFPPLLYYRASLAMGNIVFGVWCYLVGGYEIRILDTFFSVIFFSPREPRSESDVNGYFWASCNIVCTLHYLLQYGLLADDVWISAEGYSEEEPLSREERGRGDR